MFGDDVAARVFAPLVADWQHELCEASTPLDRLRSAVRGSLALASSVTAVAARATLAGPVATAALRRGGAIFLGFALLGAALLLVPLVPGFLRRGSGLASTMPYMLPAAAAVCVPYALVPFAMAVAASTPRAARWRTRGILVVGALMATGCLVLLLGWAAPASGLAWREAVTARPVAVAGPREMTALELRAAAIASLTNHRDLLAGADPARELLRRTAVATLWPAALLCLGWRLGRHRQHVSVAGLLFWWAFPCVIALGLQPALMRPTGFRLSDFMATPEFSAAAIWLAMALAFRPRVPTDRQPADAAHRPAPRGV
ncbi:MAG: hypothetical protein R2745_16125 [Vicinamibacterales bacterium]